MAQLPANVLTLRAHGLQILTCQDIRSYKKLIPSLLLDGSQFFAIADDDLFYGRHWLRDLSQAYRAGSKEVLCGRAHRIRLDERSGKPLPYSEWETDVESNDSDRLLFPTGVGGVLYPPGIFHLDVTRSDRFLTLCPTADDVWLYWMATLNGAVIKKVGRKKRQVLWPGSQRVTLYSANVAANDEQIRNIMSMYGFPAQEPVQIASGPKNPSPLTMDGRP